jgi:hypothetical protein
MDLVTKARQEKKYSLAWPFVFPYNRVLQGQKAFQITRNFIGVKMSINIHIVGRREVQVVKTGMVITQQAEYFDCWQTPSNVSQQIMSGNNPLLAYKNWVTANSIDVTEPLYSEDDPLCIGEVVGVQVYNTGREHLEQLDRWIEVAESEGYEIVVEAW